MSYNFKNLLNIFFTSSKTALKTKSSAIKSFGSSLYKKITPRKLVSVIKIEGYINSITGLKLIHTVKNVPQRKTKALVVMINSQGGNLGQALIIKERLSFLKYHCKAPLFIFIQDFALQGAYEICSIGDKIYAEKTSLIGGLGRSKKYFQHLNRPFDKLGIEY